MKQLAVFVSLQRSCVLPAVAVAISSLLPLLPQLGTSASAFGVYPSTSTPLPKTISSITTTFRLSTPQYGVVGRVPTQLFAAAADEEEEEAIEEDDYDDDDDEIEIKPYGNRSLAWTKRYRKLNPYEKVRDRVIRNFGHRSKEDWDECVANGWHGQYVPSRPDEMYAPEWLSWDEFLGIMRDYNDARNLAVNLLGLKSLDDYIIFVRSDSKRAEGLRIPVRPDLYYKEKGWIDEATFFSKDE